MAKIARTLTFSALLMCSIFSFGTLGVSAANDLPSGNNQNGSLQAPNLPGTSQRNFLIKCGNENNNPCDWADLTKLVQDLLNLAIAFSTFVAAGAFMYAGFLLITAAGNPAQIERAKAVFRRVIIGYLILFMSFLLVVQTLKYLDLVPGARAIIGKFIELAPANSNQ